MLMRLTKDTSVALRKGKGGVFQKRLKIVTEILRKGGHQIKKVEEEFIFT